MKPKYKFRYDEDGNVLFLDYTHHGEEYASYAYRWVWSRQNHISQVDDWFLIPFPNFHPNSLDLLPTELEMAARAWKEINGEMLQ